MTQPPFIGFRYNNLFLARIVKAPYYWISKTPKPDPMDYAIYLVKRTLRKRPKYALEDYEQSALHRLQNMLAQKWEFICMQAADQMRLYKDKRKSDQIVLEAQERAFWRVHHPPPSRLSCFKEGLPRNGLVNRRSLSWRRAHVNILLNRDRMFQHRPSDSCLLARQQQCRQQPPPLQSHSHLRISNKKSTENILLFTANRSSYDWFLSDLHSSSSTMSATAWLSQPGSIEQSPCQPLVTLPTCDSLLTSFPLGSRLSISSSGTVTESTPYPTVNQVRLWATSFDNLLWDPKGCQAFKAFLEKEFSSENLRFWLTVNAYQFTPISNLRAAGKRIFDEFLAPNAPSEINIDCTTRAATAEAVKNPSWFVFLEAKQHIYKLMKSDSYVRFLRSDDYSAVLRVVLANQHSGHSRRSTVKPSLATSVPSAAEDSGLAVSSSLSQKQRCSN
uniref:RGS domain-containing protein n=1 Tax=Mesocestoides corti TaxID=53468 RepID=A0A5K3EP10_MESCO